MPNIDVNVSADLQKLFELPACIDLKLPSHAKLSVTLPTGGSIKAIGDISKGIPNDCSMIVSLMLQLAVHGEYRLPAKAAGSDRPFGGGDQSGSGSDQDR